MALETASLFGPSKVFAIDQVAHRLAEAERLGAIAVDGSQVDPVEAVLDQTGGRGADKVVEAAGPPATVKIAFDVLGQGGVLSQVGASMEPTLPVDMTKLMRKDLTYKIGGGLAAAGLAGAGAAGPGRPAAPGAGHHAPRADVGGAGRLRDLRCASGRRDQDGARPYRMNRSWHTRAAVTPHAGPSGKAGRCQLHSRLD